MSSVFVVDGGCEDILLDCYVILKISVGDRKITHVQNSF